MYNGNEAADHGYMVDQARARVGVHWRWDHTSDVVVLESLEHVRSQ